MAGDVRFTPTERDWIAANRAWMLLSLRRPTMIWCASIFGVAFLVSAAATVAMRQDPMPLAWMALVALLYLGLQLLNWALIPRSVRRMMRQRHNIATETRFEWTAEGIEATSEAGVTRQKWPHLHRWFEGSHGFVFLLSDRLMLVLPASALTAQQRSDLSQTARRHAP